MKIGKYSRYGSIIYLLGKALRVNRARTLKFLLTLLCKVKQLLRDKITMKNCKRAIETQRYHNMMQKCHKEKKNDYKLTQKHRSTIKRHKTITIGHKTILKREKMTAKRK